jgi:membrane protein implicated in regulation of membrane protease activity
METRIPEPRAAVGDLVHRISDDVKTIARDEIELAKLELAHSAKIAAIDGAAVVLGGVVALIGLAMLATAVAVALAPIIPPLWLRLVIMAIVYLTSGVVVAASFAKRLKHDAVPHLTIPRDEMHQTIGNIKAGLAR